VEQAVAFFSLPNRGAARRLSATASLTVVRDGVCAASIRGNPVRYRFDQRLAHGTSSLFDARWSNWCGARSGFEIEAGLGRQTASGRFAYLPICIPAHAPSRLTGVRSPAGPSPHVGP